MNVEVAIADILQNIDNFHGTTIPNDYSVLSMVSTNEDVAKAALMVLDPYENYHSLRDIPAGKAAYCEFQKL